MGNQEVVEKEGSIFFEKKKQKTFDKMVQNAHSSDCYKAILKLTKFFCFFLFTKRRFLLRLNLLIYLVIIRGRH